MKKELVFSTKVGGFPLTVEQDQTKAARLTVTYGRQVRDGLTYVDAAKEVGLCLFHGLACDGKLNNDGA